MGELVLTDLRRLSLWSPSLLLLIQSLRQLPNHLLEQFIIHVLTNNPNIHCPMVNPMPFKSLLQIQLCPLQCP